MIERNRRQQSRQGLQRENKIRERQEMGEQKRKVETERENGAGKGK